MAMLRPEVRRQRVAELRRDGLSYRAIGRELGISHELARKDARAAGLTPLTSVPGGLAARGLSFWQHATTAFEMDRHEQELLMQVCRLLDRADALQAEVDALGPMVETSRGDRRPNPAIAEERQCSLALGRLLALLEIPAEDERSSPRSGWSRRAQGAAQVRWGVSDSGSGGVS
jgi:hypothetical protein